MKGLLTLHLSGEHRDRSSLSHVIVKLRLQHGTVAVSARHGERAPWRK